MDVQFIVLGFAVLVTILVTAGWLSPRIYLPTPTVQFLLGATVANIIVMYGIDTGLRYQNFHDLVFYLFLPLLVFAAAYEIDLQRLREHLTSVLSLAFFGLLVTTGLTALCVYFAIDHSGFPWLAALLTGSLLAATDPAAVTSQAWLHHVKPNLALLLEGESLINDATAVVLFSVILGLAMATLSLTTSQTPPPGDIALGAAITFAREIFGGAFIGALAGIVGSVINKSNPLNLRIWIGLAMALGAYHASLSVHASGVIACLVAGLILGRHSHEQIGATKQWNFIAETTNGVLFILMGATITMAMFTERWLAMCIAIIAVQIARFISVHVVLGLPNQFIKHPTSAMERNQIGMLGLRGAITIGLVLVLPTDLPYWWTIQSIAYGVVLFDLVVTAPLMPVFFKPRQEASQA